RTERGGHTKDAGPQVEEQECVRAGLTVGHHRPDVVVTTVRESNSRLRFGRPGPSHSDNRGTWKRNRERPAGTAPALPTWQAGVPLTTPWPRGAPRRTCTGMRRGCSSPPIYFGPAERTSNESGDCANRTRATVVGHGLANRPVTTPARLLTFPDSVPPRRFERLSLDS